MKYSQTEIKELLIGWGILSLAFGIVLHGGPSLDFAFAKSVLLSALTAGIGFILHELAHKYFAQKFGCFAEFRMNFQMLLLALLMSFFGFMFAAPGAVMIRGNPGRIRMGQIAVAGPLMNVVIALGFGALLFLGSGFWLEVASYGFFINSMLALFNLLPFGMFDGAKVLAWSKVWYGASVVAAGALTFAAFNV
ncbi:MAG: metalloprotease [Nanoarchaeota archaeon]